MLGLKLEKGFVYNCHEQYLGRQMVNGYPPALLNLILCLKCYSFSKLAFLGSYTSYREFAGGAKDC